MTIKKFSSVVADDGKFVGDSDVGEFWSFFGGYAPIPRDVPSDQKSTDSSIILFWLGSLQQSFPSVQSSDEFSFN